jgi:heptosyltransferase-1
LKISAQERGFERDPARPKRILIVRVGAMGDVVHGLAAAAALRKARPDWVIDWAVDPRWADLLVGWDGAGVRAEFERTGRAGGGPVVDGVVAVRTRLWKARPFSVATARDVLGLRRMLREGRYDFCVDLQGTMRSAVIGWMAGARRFVGPAEPREGVALGLYGEKVRTGATHVIDQGCEILGAAVGRALRVETSREARCGTIPVVEADEVWAEAFLDGLLGGGEARKIVVMAPTAGWRSKEWPAERFGEVAARLEGWTTLVNAGPGSGAVVEAVIRASGGRALAAVCSIGQLGALLRRAGLFVGGDTGPMHLADTLGVPVVALFGPTDPARNGPYGGEGSRFRVLRHPESRTDHGRHRVTEAGLAKIMVDEVLEAVREVLGEDC